LIRQQIPAIIAILLSGYFLRRRALEIRELKGTVAELKSERKAFYDHYAKVISSAHAMSQVLQRREVKKVTPMMLQRRVVLAINTIGMLPLPPKTEEKDAGRTESISAED
jgi:hypothetical protein